jgi:GT2 family glycosyltransferase
MTQKNENAKQIIDPKEVLAPDIVPDFAPFTVIITYHSNIQHLVSILNNFQAQLLPPKKIIIIDTSPNKSGLDTAQKFNTGPSEVIVECAKVGIYEAWNRGIDLAGSDDVFICNDDLILPLNITDVLLIAKVSVQALCYVPVTPPKDHSANFVKGNFYWYAGIPQSMADFAYTDWMPGFCFYLTRKAIEEIGTFDTKFKVWFGDDDYQSRLLDAGKRNHMYGIVRLETAYVYHYGGKSYRYQTKEVQDLIGQDRDYFAKKYNLEQGELSNATD